MFDVVLFSPRIPPNTGNVIRLCANTGCRLHLVEPLGFVLDEARVRRAGLDYHDMAVVTVHPSLDAARAALADRRWFATTARGGTRPRRSRSSPATSSCSARSRPACPPTCSTRSARTGGCDCRCCPGTAR